MCFFVCRKISKQLHVSNERSGFEPWPGTLRCVLGQDALPLTVPVSIQVYKWVFNAGGNLVMHYHPLQRGVEILLFASCYRNRDKPRSDGHLACMQTLYIIQQDRAALLVTACKYVTKTSH